MIGMLTEAFIFLMLGLLPPHKDYYWERYYPNLDENPHVEAYKKGIKMGKQDTPKLGFGAGSGGAASATASLDKMLEEAEMNPANLRKLSENFSKFGETVNQVKDITNVTIATNAYADKAKEATTALDSMKNTFSGATATMNSFNAASEDTAKFHSQVQVLTKNLGSLNNIYEVELNDANNHLKAMNKFYGNLVNASESMASSAEDANRAKDQIALLAKNLGSLNQVYGNMLNAMQGRA